MTIHEVAEAVAAEFGPAWRVREREKGQWDRRAAMIGPDRAQINFHLITYPKLRVGITGDFPNGFRPWRSEDVVSMTVAPDRPPHQIAGEIRRKLLPTYLPQFAEALERKRNTEHGDQIAEAVSTRLANLLGTTTRQRGPGEERVIYLSTPMSGDLRIHNGGTVTMELRSLTSEQAERVARALIE